MRRFFALVAVSMFALPFGVTASAEEAEVVTPKEVIHLIGDKPHDNFYTWLQDSKYEDPRKVFRVTDGLLHVTGDGLGCVTTKQAYRDYHLVLEFRFGKRTWRNRTERTKDSGLLIHSQGADGGYGGIWMPSIEVQIIEGGMGDYIMVAGKDKDGEPVPMSLTCEVDRDRDGEVIWKKGGKREVFDMNNRKRINWYGRDPDWADKLGFRGKDDLDDSDKEWTRFDVICEGGHIQNYVNGTLVNEAFDAQPNHGRIQLQTELAEIFFRRLDLYPLGKGPKPGPAENKNQPIPEVKE
jgi:hypothetical protein